MIKLVTADNLDTRDFTIENNKVRVKSNETIKNYILDNVAYISFQGNENDRKRLSVKNGLGILHLDFTPNFNTIIKKKLFELPPDAPVPLTTLEHQFKNGGSAWIEAGQREVWGHWLERGERVIFDLVGFFE